MTVSRLNILLTNDSIPVDICKAHAKSVNIGLKKISCKNTWSFWDYFLSALEMNNRKL